MVLAADEQLLSVVILLFSALLLVAQELSKLAFPGCLALLTMLVKSGLKC